MENDVTEFSTVPFLGVPVIASAPDVVLPNLGSIYHDAPRRIVFLEAWDIWRLVWSKKLRSRWAAASIHVMAVTGPSVAMIRLATGRRVPRFGRFHTVIRTLSHAEEHGARVFLLDRRIETLQKVEANLRSTFPGLHIAGRSVLSKSVADSVQVAIKKSAAHFVLAGLGKEGRRHWISDNYQSFGTALSINAHEVFGTMTGGNSPFRIWLAVRIPAYCLLVLVLLGIRVFSSGTRGKQ